MPSMSFTIYNTNEDQSFTVNDLKDTTKNPIWTGAINHNSSSPPIQCWKGSDERGRIEILGSASGDLLADVDDDGAQVRY